VAAFSGPALRLDPPSTGDAWSVSEFDFAQVFQSAHALVASRLQDGSRLLGMFEALLVMLDAHIDAI
jgi:hypothetical protein